MGKCKGDARERADAVCRAGEWLFDVFYTRRLEKERSVLQAKEFVGEEFLVLWFAVTMRCCWILLTLGI